MTSNLRDIQMFIREYSEQLYANILYNFEKMKKTPRKT